MVAYQGEVRLEHKGRGLGRFFKKALTGEGGWRLSTGMWQAASSEGTRSMCDDVKQSRTLNTPASGEPLGFELLDALLEERIQCPRQANQIDAKIRQAFEREVAVLILDMCGFSRLTARYGIIHCLCMVRQIRLGSIPAVEHNGGTVLKQEADNLYAIFRTVEQALEAALDIFHAFTYMNGVLPEDRDIFGSVGTGFGPTLVLGCEDFFGEEVNRASKLGEDSASKMEILLTERAYNALPSGRYKFAHKLVKIEELEIQAFSFLRRG